jgi:hypothetical protein
VSSRTSRNIRRAAIAPPPMLAKAKPLTTITKSKVLKAPFSTSVK